MAQPGRENGFYAAWKSLTAQESIRKALQEQFGNRHLNLSLERLEFLRKWALDKRLTDQNAPKGSLSSDEEAALIDLLRTQYRINTGWAFARMDRITQMGAVGQHRLYCGASRPDLRDGSWRPGVSPFDDYRENPTGQLLSIVMTGPQACPVEQHGVLSWARGLL